MSADLTDEEQLARLRERLAVATPDELRLFIRMADEAAARSGAAYLDSRKAYWREAAAVAHSLMGTAFAWANDDPEAA